MKGDRVRIGHGGVFKESEAEHVLVYRPKLDQNGRVIEAGDGTALVESVGGVKVGSTGTIQGPPLKVNKMQLKTFQNVPGIVGNDHIMLYPIFLDHYQQMGWFPVDDIRIVSGAAQE